ncbi:MAG: ComEC/Rec2 family competence protein [Cellulophaga sp.]
MGILKFVSVKLLLSLIIGIVLGFYCDISLPLFLAFSITSFISLGLVLFLSKRKKTFLFGALAAITTMSIGFASVTITQSKNYITNYENQNLKENQTLHLKIREILKPNLYSNRYIASIYRIDTKKASGKIILNIKVDSTTQKLEIDHELFVYSKLQEVKTSLNPHQFDYKNYLRKLGIVHQIQLYDNNYFLKEDTSKTIYGIAATIRENIISKLKLANFKEEELGIIQALLLGQRNDISTKTYEDYKNAGAVHILAVSGLHIGIILLILSIFLKPLERLKYGKTIKLISIVILLWCFALLAGFSASILRAVSMFSFLAYAQYLNRPTNTFNIMALSMFFILLFSPLLLFQVGFQMSYAAVFSIVWVYPMLLRFWYPKNWATRKIWQLLSVSLAAQLGVLPISLFYFHQFPGLFFISNLLIVPFLGIILGCGILVILLALLNTLPEFLILFYSKLIYGMNAIIKWVATQEGFIFTNISFDSTQLLLGYLGIITMLLAFTKRSFKRISLFLLTIIGFQIYTFYSGYTAQQKNAVLVLHQTRNTLLLHQTKRNLSVITSNDMYSNKLISNYEVAERITQIQYQTLKNVYKIEEKKLFVVDSLGIFPPKKIIADYILLTQSPKISLDRLITTTHPKMIIADGSNYKNNIAPWRKTCAKRKLPFHYTGEKGAYYFK